MGAVELLKELETLGVSVSVDGDENGTASRRQSAVRDDGAATPGQGRDHGLADPANRCLHL